MAPTLVFLPSPLLGPSVWRPVAERVAARGRETVVAPVPVPVPMRRAEDVVDVFTGACPTESDLVLVPHSNAGAFVPTLVRRRSVTATVFVDAILPPPEGEVPLAPPFLLDHLRTLADDHGLLPPWTNWWPDDVVDELLPDPVTRSAVEGEQQRLPSSYFAQAVPADPGWDIAPGAYLAFGDTYADERDDAVRRGWPTRTLPGNHLHQLHDPTAVAETVVALLDEIVAGD